MVLDGVDVGVRREVGLVGPGPLKTVEYSSMLPPSFLISRFCVFVYFYI